MEFTLFPNVTPTLAGMAAVDLCIVLAALALARIGFARMITSQPTAELIEHDNPACGVFVAGAAVAIAIVLAGAAEGPYALSIGQEAANLAAAAAAGLVLLGASSVLADRVAPTHQLIRERNTAAATREAGRLIATAVILHGALTVAPATWPEGPIVLAGAFAVSLAILAAIGAVRAVLFRRRNDGRRFADAIHQGNTPLAVRFSGYQVGVAIAVAAASPAVDVATWASPEAGLLALDWAIHAVVAAAAVLLVAAAAEHTVLAGIPTSREVDRERNLGIAAIEAAIAVGAGLAVASVIG